MGKRAIQKARPRCNALAALAARRAAATTCVICRAALAVAVQHQHILWGIAGCCSLHGTCSCQGTCMQAFQSMEQLNIALLLQHTSHLQLPAACWACCDHSRSYCTLNCVEVMGISLRSQLFLHVGRLPHLLGYPPALCGRCHAPAFHPANSCRSVVDIVKHFQATDGASNESICKCRLTC